MSLIVWNKERFLQKRARTPIILGTHLRLVFQSCPTPCNPMDWSPPGSSVYRDSPGKNTGVGCHVLLRGSSWSRDRTQFSCIAGRFFIIWAPRKPKNTEVDSLLYGILLTQELNRGLLHCRRILYQLSYQGSPGIHTVKP